MLDRIVEAEIESAHGNSGNNTSMSDKFLIKLPQ